MTTAVQFELDESIKRRFGTLADDAPVLRTVAALEDNGIRALQAVNAAAAKRIVLDVIPDGSEVHSGASQSLEISGIIDEIEASSPYDALRPRIWSLDRDTQADEIRRVSAAPEVMLGSVHAVTESGALLAASMSGSQLGPYASGAPGESSSSWGRRRSCRTSRKDCAGSTSTRSLWRMLARRRRTASAAP